MRYSWIRALVSSRFDHDRAGGSRRRPSSPRSRAGASLVAALALAIAVAPSSACSLGDVKRDSCSADADCAGAFGVGSKCQDGYCSEAARCATGHDCRRAAGGGACVQGVCQAAIPTDPACSIVEPPDLLSKPLVGDGAPLVVGAIFAKEDAKNDATTKAVRLAVQEIDKTGGMLDGRPLGLVVCDNGGPGNAAQGDARTTLDNHALDYLAGTLGVPFLVGPRTSADALKIVSRLVEKQYPTVVISPSATSPALTGVPDKLAPGDFGLFWRTCPSDTLQGKVLAKLVATVPMVAKAAVFYSNDAYGLGLSQAFQLAFGTQKTALVQFDSAQLDTPGVVGGLVKLALDQSPQAVVIIAVQAQDTVKLLSGMSSTPLAQARFFFTDGSKDATHLLDPMLPAAVKTIVKSAQGTAPASNTELPGYSGFKASLLGAFPGLDPDSYSFLAHAYDAAYVGAYGVVYAARKHEPYDGRQVAEGLAHLIAGDKVNVGPIPWPMGKADLAAKGQIDITGITGDLQFDPKTGEAPGIIEVWQQDPMDPTTFKTLTTELPN